MEELKQRILRDGRAKAEGGGQFLRDHHIPYHALAIVKRIREGNSLELA